MNKSMWYTDPHQGVDLKSNTTAHSRAALRTQQHVSLLGAINGFRRHNPQGVVGCAGDFFDTDSNSEDTIMRAVQVAQVTDFILGGNHDVRNAADSHCSLDVLAEIFPDKVTKVKFDSVQVEVKEPEQTLTTYYMVPHHTNQTLFEEALESAIKKVKARKERSGRVHYLVLHCNYDSGFAVQDTALNLPATRARKLLEHFDYILIGHDHHHKTDMDDRIIVLGNTFPINFGDISEKYALIIGEDGHPDCIETLWNPARHYVEWDVTQGEMPNDLEFLQFVKVVGEIEAEQLYEVTKAITSLWKTHPALLAVKPEFTIKAPVGQDPEAAGVSQMNLIDRIRRELEDHKELQALFNELLGDNP